MAKGFVKTACLATPRDFQGDLVLGGCPKEADGKRRTGPKKCAGCQLLKLIEKASDET
jgi:hypothetical protein